MDFKEQSKVFKEVLKAIGNKKVAVIGHMRPDGDCIGAQVAMVQGLSGCGIEVVALNKDSVPEILGSFVGNTPFIHEDFERYKDYIPITVDCSDKMRMGDELESLFPNIKLNIDHHLSNTQFGESNIIDAKSAASCEIIAKLFIDNRIAINAITANALYLGIATDTGQFKYSTTNGEVFLICEKLIELGANPSHIANEVYEQETMPKIRLLKEFLGTLKLELEDRVCIGFLTQAMFHSTGTNKELTEGLVDYPRSIKGVVIAALVEERADGKIKTSLRAKEERYRVDLLAKRFKGGGHACAAGFSDEESLEVFYPQFIQAIKEHLESLGI